MTAVDGPRFQSLYETIESAKVGLVDATAQLQADVRHFDRDNAALAATGAQIAALSDALARSTAQSKQATRAMKACKPDGVWQLYNGEGIVITPPVPRPTFTELNRVTLEAHVQ